MITMTAEQYCTILNKYFENKYGRDKGFFIITQSFTPGPTKIFRKYLMEIIFHDSKGINHVAHFIQQVDRIPYGQEEEYKEKMLQQLVLDITSNPDLIDKYGV